MLVFTHLKRRASRLIFWLLIINTGYYFFSFAKFCVTRSIYY